jgi:hypothetical protein
MNLPLIPQDKANHVIYGLAIFMVVAFLLDPISGVAAAIFGGAMKETYDMVSGKGHAHGLDFVATVVGGILGLLCTYLS